MRKVIAAMNMTVDGNCDHEAGLPDEEILELKKQSGKAILIGSPGLIIQLMNLNLVDELQLCVHPVVAGRGLQLFENIKDRTLLKMVNTKVFSNGSVILYYEPGNK